MSFEVDGAKRVARRHNITPWGKCEVDDIFKVVDLIVPEYRGSEALRVGGDMGRLSMTWFLRSFIWRIKI